MPRKPLSKRIRFEVFKRDSFTCQYCGRKAPDVILEVDHINPVANDGNNDIMNLIASCFDCNHGKGKRTLTDSQIIDKQREQLDILNEKRNQMEMILEWKKEIESIEEKQVEEVFKSFNSECDTTFTYPDQYKREARRVLRKYGLEATIKALKTSVSQYYKDTNESAGKAFLYIGKIADISEKSKSDPMIYRKMYIRGIIKNRMPYFNEWKLRELLNELCIDDNNASIIEKLAKESRGWKAFLEDVEDVFYEDEEGENVE